MVDMTNDEYSDNEKAMEDFSVSIGKIHEAQQSTVKTLLKQGLELQCQMNPLNDQDFEAIDCIKQMEQVNLLNKQWLIDYAMGGSDEPLTDFDGMVINYYFLKSTKEKK